VNVSNRKIEIAFIVSRDVGYTVWIPVNIYRGIEAVDLHGRGMIGQLLEKGVVAQYTGKSQHKNDQKK
jgi:hypothetical protein